MGRRRGELQDQIANSVDKDPIEVEELVGPNIKKITQDRLISSGVTLLNCACSDNPFGAFALGSINTVPGKSASGKTELMLSMLASCAIDSRFDNYELILDDAEHSMSFDLDYLFPSLVDRLGAPAYDGDDPVYSDTIQDFEGNILVRCKMKETKEKKRKPFIWVLDSLDSLSSTEELEREFKNALKTAKSDEAVKEIKKSYGTEKARIIGSVLRMVNGLIKNSDSALFIVQQTRQKIKEGFQGFGGEPWTTSGGEAPYFYSFHRLFLDSGKNITGESMNIKHKIGGHTYAQVIKNKLNGKRRSVEFDIYEDLGIDDVASCVDFLKKTEYWPTLPGGYIQAKEILGRNKMYRSDLIQSIEKENAEPVLRETVGKVWGMIEDDIRLKDRKRRF